ncbi:MAG: aldo/keto reductase, partial [Spirochaetota bacterium]
MGTIPTTTIGDHLEIPRIVTGLWQVAGGHGEIDPGKAVDHMASLHAEGLTAFDMADHYGPA